MTDFYPMTCLGPGGWDLYGREMVESFVKHWDPSIHLVVYHHDCEAPAYENERVVFVSLNVAAPEFAKFRAAHEKMNGMSPEGHYNFRYDAVKFSSKVYAQAHYITQLQGLGKQGFMLWLDGDTVTKVVVDKDFLEKIVVDTDIVHLPRKALPYSETSFVSYALNQKCFEFMADFIDTYVDGQLFFYMEWHDGFIFSRLLYLHELHGLKVKSLTPPEYGGIDAFENSILGTKMIHNKGNRKQEPSKKVLMPGMPLKITPHDCVDSSHLLKNVETNIPRIQRWIPICKAHKEKVVIVSGGIDALKRLDEIRALVDDGAKLVTMKHSLKWMLDAGLVPWGCVILDPRPIDGLSTHGFNRRELLSEVPKETIFFVASMTDVSVLDHLLEKKANILGWHAYTQGLKDFKLPENHVMITGGTCAAWRAIGLHEIMGFREMHLFGYDFCYWDEQMEKKDKQAKDEHGRPLYLKVGIGLERRPFWSTGEMLAGAQDTEDLVRMADRAGIEMTFHGDGIAPEIAKGVKLTTKRDFYQEIR